MTIRDAALSDLQDLTVLGMKHIAASPIYSDLPIDEATLQSNLVRDITDNGTIFKIYVDAEGVTRAFVRGSIGTFYINAQKYIPDVMLVVDPTTRNAGYGAKLLIELHGIAAAKGVKAILFIDTADIDNGGVENLVTGLGYKTNGNVFRGDVEDLTKPQTETTPTIEPTPSPYEGLV